MRIKRSSGAGSGSIAGCQGVSTSTSRTPTVSRIGDGITFTGSPAASRVAVPGGMTYVTVRELSGNGAGPESDEDEIEAAEAAEE